MRVLLATAAVTSALRLQHIDVVLVGPQYASNVGQALRLCACFEVGRLKLVAPEYDRVADATYERRFAMPQGRAVRDERTIVCDTLDEALADVEFSVAFSGRGRADDQFAAAAPALAARVDSRTALVFGREADGLRAEELARCGASVEIASADSLNLSHAVAIALADIYARAAESGPAAPDVAPDATVDALVSRLGAALGADEGFRATSRGKVPAGVESTSRRWRETCFPRRSPRIRASRSRGGCCDGPRRRPPRSGRCTGSLGTCLVNLCHVRSFHLNPSVLQLDRSGCPRLWSAQTHLT